MPKLADLKADYLAKDKAKADADGAVAAIQSQLDAAKASQQAAIVADGQAHVTFAHAVLAAGRPILDATDPANPSIIQATADGTDVTFTALATLDFDPEAPAPAPAPAPEPAPAPTPDPQPAPAQ